MSQSLISRAAGVREWIQRGYAPPAPGFIRRAVLRRNSIPGAPWVETGTFKGNTTAWLAKQYPQVYTIEPDNELCRAARKRFAKTSNVEVIHGTSEDVMPTLVERLTGSVNFWLDGHYSGGVTHHGPEITPIRAELNAIARGLTSISPLAILIDDVRCFHSPTGENEGYPPLYSLVEWAEQHHLIWHIEHDIFVAKTASLSSR